MKLDIYVRRARQDELDPVAPIHIRKFISSVRWSFLPDRSAKSSTRVKVGSSTSVDLISGPESLTFIVDSVRSGHEEAFSLRNRTIARRPKLNLRKYAAESIGITVEQICTCVMISVDKQSFGIDQRLDRTRCQS